MPPRSKYGPFAPLSLTAHVFLASPGITGRQKGALDVEYKGPRSDNVNMATKKATKRLAKPRERRYLPRERNIHVIPLREHYESLRRSLSKMPGSPAHLKRRQAILASVRKGLLL